MQINIEFSNIKRWAYPLVSEISLYFLIYYVQYLLSLEDIVNLWGSSALLWVLVNVSLLGCPLFNKGICAKKVEPHRPESKGKKPF